MPVNLTAPRPGELHPVPGVRIGVAEAGIRKANRRDLTVVLIDPGASVAGVFTQNRFCAAPVQVPVRLMFNPPHMRRNSHEQNENGSGDACPARLP